MKRTVKHPPARFAAAVLALLLCAGGTSTNGVAAETGAQDEDRAYFSDLPVVTSDGEALRFFSDVLDGQVVLINFVFTTCQGACPIQSAVIAEAGRLLGERMGNGIRFVSISVDPANDTPAALAAYAKRFGAGDGWLFLTGDEDHIRTITRRLGERGPTLEGHSTGLFAGNVRTRHWTRLPPNAPAELIALQLRRLAGELDGL